PSRSNPQRRTRRPRNSREYPKPGPTDTAMFGRFPGEEQGEAVKSVLRTNNPSKRMADPAGIAKLAGYLASHDSACVVGADFLIDGGSRPFRAWAPEPRCRESRLFLLAQARDDSRRRIASLNIVSRYPTWVIHVIPAIPVCPVRPKSGHSANARVF